MTASTSAIQRPAARRKRDHRLRPGAAAAAFVLLGAAAAIARWSWRPS